MLIIKRITPQTVELFDPNDNSLGFVNEYEFNEVRLQIAENRLDGYYIIFNDRRIFIQNDGKLDEWVNGLFDHFTNFAVKLFKVQREIYKENSNG